eukprot:6744029-Prymnesium_polylepis.1
MVVVKLMGDALGIALMDPTHGYAGLTPHCIPRSSPELRHPVQPTVPYGPYGSSYRGHTEAHKPSWWLVRVLAVANLSEPSCHSHRSPGRALSMTYK